MTAHLKSRNGRRPLLAATVFTASALASAISLQTAASAQTVEQRLQALEEKTSFYKITKSVFGPVAMVAQSGSLRSAFVMKVPTPMTVHAWVRFTGEYTNSSAHTLNVTWSLSNSPSGTLTCSDNQHLPPNSSGPLDWTVYCLGYLNPYSRAISADVRAKVGSTNATVSLQNVSVEFRSVNLVVTEPPAQ